MPYIDSATSTRVAGQFPQDVKLYVLTLANLIDLGTSNFKAYYYYDRMKVLCLEDNKEYVWRERKVEGEEGGALVNDFVYPSGTTANGIDYSNKSYNFFEFFANVKEALPISENYGAVYTGENLDVFAYAEPIIINNKIVNIAGLIISLPPPPVTLGETRVDAVVANINGTISIVSGEEGLIKQYPNIDVSTQKVLNYFILDYNSTAPENILDVQIYDENVGNPVEFDATESTGATRIVLNSNNSPDSNIVHIEGVDVIDGDFIYFTSDDLLSIINLDSIYFKLETTVKAVKIKIYLYDEENNATLFSIVEPGKLGYKGVVAGYQYINGQKLSGVNLVNDFIKIGFELFGAFSENIPLIRIDNIRLLYNEEKVENFLGTFLGLTDVVDSSYAEKVDYIPAVLPNGGLKLKRLTDFKDLIDLINKKIDVAAIWLGGLDFRVIANSFPINNEWYSATSNTVTLDAAHPTLDRIDLIVARKPIEPATVGTVTKITGTPATSELIIPPEYDRSEYFVIKSVIIRAGQTEPEGFLTTVVFDEQDPGEYTLLLPASFAVTGTSTSSGAVALESTNQPQGHYVTFTAPVDTTTNIVDLLTFDLKLKEELNGQHIVVQFRKNGSVLRTLTFPPGVVGYDDKNTDYQEIRINKLLLNLPVADYNNIKIGVAAITEGIFIDNVKIHTGSGYNGSGYDTPSRTSELVNDGSDGINPFITKKEVQPRVIDGYIVDTTGNTDLDAIEVDNICAGIRGGNYVVFKVNALPYTNDANIIKYVNNSPEI